MWKVLKLVAVGIAGLAAIVGAFFAIEAHVKEIADFVDRNRPYLMPAVFLLMFAESLAVVSIVVPAIWILTAVSAALGAAKVGPEILVPLWVVGALGGALGYAISFWIGKWIGNGIDAMWPFTTYAAARRELDRAREFIAHRHGFAFTAVFMGHFLGPVRGMVPLVVGTMNMSHGTFQLANVTSSVLQPIGVIVIPYYGFTGGLEVFNVVWAWLTT